VILVVMALILYAAGGNCDLLPDLFQGLISENLA
jgi:hypothetical protein